MRQIARAATTLSAAVLAAGAITVGGAGVAQATGGHCGYPPHQCGISFDRDHYFPGQDVGFRTDKAFKRGETVEGHYSCRHNVRRHVGPYTANNHHRVVGSFTLKKPTPKGTCTLRLIGQTTGYDAVGSFNVRHHNSGAATGTSGQSSAGGSVLSSGVLGGSALTGSSQNSAATTTSTTSTGASVLGSNVEAAAPTATTEGANLPFTGSAYTVPMTVLGAALLALGGALLFIVRRRRSANGLA